MPPSGKPPKASNPNPTACLSCREKHLKCGGQAPICARCVTAGIECVWVQSRRGRGSRPPKWPAVAARAQAPAKVAIPASLDYQQDPASMSGMLASSIPYSLTGPGLSASEETISLPALTDDPLCPNEEQLIGLYYKYIHPAHPFILPRMLYSQNPGVFPRHLRTAMCYIASHHSTSLTHDSESWRDASQMVYNPSIPEDGFKVQTLLLIALASFARFERDRGVHALKTAVDIAGRLGLGSSTHGSGEDPIFQESWRRTWWELYSITGLISLISGTDLRLNQTANMTLPYACELYEACQTAPAGTVEDIKQRSLLDSPSAWSSFAYRVEATRILSSILDITSDSPPAQCDAAAASISSYLLSLPAEKREGLQPNGEVDEVMVCALMIIHLANISLNQPRSALSQLRDFQTICGNARGQVESETPRTSEAAAVRSAKVITKLISAHSTLTTLSPCFSCGIAFSAVVLLSEYIVRPSHESEYLKENVQFELTALRSLGEVWPIARVVRGQIAQFSREALKVPSQRQQVPVDEGLPAIGATMQDEQWLQELIHENIIPGNDDLSMFGAVNIT